MPRVVSKSQRRRRAAQSASPRKDPEHRPVDNSTTMDDLACKDPDRHYVQVDPRREDFGQAYYEHVKGYTLELNRPGGVFSKRKGRGPEGSPVLGAYGTVVMSIDRATKEWYDENGLTGKGGQKKIDRLEQHIFNDSRKRGHDPFRGMYVDGLKGDVAISGQASPAKELGLSEARKVLEHT